MATWQNGAQQSVKIVGTTIEIDGIPRTLMCSSLFPFRIPRSQWRTRLQAVKNLGYQVIDTYAPWNWHETSPGHFNFTGQNDFEEFLRLTAETGLYALVRPGPYICSEWDGGAIPAWISTDPALKGKLRQNDPNFLAAVGRWYDQIIPIIVRQQYGHGGSVILVQADNELDFYGCADPHGYIAALAGMMRDRGITVPIIACAGQGDLRGAGFGAPGVHPAFNIYPDDMTADVDAHVRYHRRVLDRENEPFIVTETNRWHRTIGRAIGNGVRLVGPYLQASGQDLAAGSTFGTSVTNWGPADAPEAFMTADYDFGGVIDPTGAERPDATRARRLSAIISALSVRLAASTLPSEEAIREQAEQWGIGRQYADHTAALGVLDLYGGGRLVTVTNVSSQPLTCTVGKGQNLSPYPSSHDGNGSAVGSATEPAIRELTAHIAPEESRLLVSHVPVTSDVQIVATDCELIGLDVCGADEMDHAHTQHVVLTFAASPEEKDPWALISLSDGSPHLISGAGKHALGDIVVSIVSSDEQEPAEAEKKKQASAQAPVREVTSVEKADDSALDALSLWKSAGSDDGDPQILERHHIWNGSGIYSADVDEQTAAHMQGIVVRGAADVVSVRARSCQKQNSKGQQVNRTDWTDWTANAGQPLWIPVHGSSLQIRTQIWGHCNFDDSRLPALSLHAGRGMTGVLAVTHRRSYATGWFLANATRPVTGLTIDPQYAPRAPLGSRSSTVWPRSVTYRHTIQDESGRNDLGGVLELKGTHVRAHVRIDGREVDDITPLKPMTWLGPIHNGSLLEVTIDQLWGEPVGDPVLLTGPIVHNWSLHACTIKELNSAAHTLSQQPDDFQPIQLPLHVRPGSPVWLRIPAAQMASSIRRGCAVCRFKGKNVQITAFTSTLCLGRIVLSGFPGTIFSGGDPGLLIIPDDGDVLLLLEATKSAGGDLQSVLLGGKVDHDRH